MAVAAAQDLAAVVVLVGCLTPRNRETLPCIWLLGLIQSLWVQEEPGVTELLPIFRRAVAALQAALVRFTGSAAAVAQDGLRTVLVIPVAREAAQSEAQLPPLALVVLVLVGKVTTVVGLLTDQDQRAMVLVVVALEPLVDLVRLLSVALVALVWLLTSRARVRLMRAAVVRGRTEARQVLVARAVAALVRLQPRELQRPRILAVAAVEALARTALQQTRAATVAAAL